MKYLKSSILESRILGYNKYLETLCKLDSEEIEFIFQDLLDEFPLMSMNVQSVPHFNDEKFPLMISLMMDKHFKFDVEIMNYEIMYTVLGIIKNDYLDQIDGRLSDFGLKTRDIRLVRVPRGIVDRFFNLEHIVLRIDRI